MPIRILRNFIKIESKSSVLLLFSLMLALIISNSPWNSYYLASINHPLTLFSLSSSLKLIVNDGLMTLFFLLISLEIKQGLLFGELSSPKKALLPFIASLSGMLMAGLIFLAINGSTNDTSIAWAVPTATDIAFSLAVLMLLGPTIPYSLRLFLTMLAIIDDIGGIFIIALFYSVNFHILFLLLAFVCFLVLLLFNKIRAFRYPFIILIGSLLWFCILKAKISPPMAGVLLGLTVSSQADRRSHISPLKKLKTLLSPWVSYFILPLFVLVNAGLDLRNIPVSNFFHPLTLGIILGLFLGKQLGIFTACWLAVKLRLAKLPDNIRWTTFYGMSILCGIGFTMNLFIGFLAFSAQPEYLNLVKLGIFCASTLSAILGYTVLRACKK